MQEPLFLQDKDADQPVSSSIPWIIVCGGLLAGEVALIANYELSATFYCGHLLLTLMTGALAFYSARFMDPRLPVLTTILLCFLGPLGALLALLIGVFQLLFSLQKHDIKQTITELFPPDEDSRVEKTVESILSGNLGWEYRQHSTSFIDVMYYATAEQKSQAISIVLRHFSPRLMPILRIALKDQENSVRVLAANAMVALEEEYYGAYLKALEQVERTPNAPTALVVCAKAGIRFVESGLADKQRTDKVRDVCTQLLSKANKWAAQDVKILAQLARLFQQQGKLKQAEEVVQQGIKISTYPHPELLLTLSSIIYSTGDYQKLRQTVAKQEWNDAVAANAVLSFWKTGRSQ